MTRKWKHKKHPKPPTGPTRGKYRQMWKVEMRDMVIGEEEPQRGEVISAIDFGRYHESRAA